MQTELLKQYFAQYLKQIRQLKDSSVDHYFDALKYISRYFVNKGMLTENIFEIRDIDKLEELRNYLYSQADFRELDTRGQRMYSAGFNNYIRFAQGEDFKSLGNRITMLDQPVPVAQTSTSTITHYVRSDIIKKQVLESADYLCEINNGHKTFVTSNSSNQYMECHHIIPLNKQPSFPVSLDVYANMICLCPTCHRLMHYAQKSVKDMYLNRLYEDRVNRYVASGIRLSKDEFRDISSN